ncbi:MAG: CoA ester lyase [Desulfobacter sp.]|nr:MAG: CoA ester lyase [Desulfobacter sp.]
MKNSIGTPDSAPARSILSVPGHRPSMHEKARLSKADVVMLDLEDSVPAAEKAKARQAVAKSLNTLDWCNKTLAVRVNSCDTPFCVRDVMETADAAGKNIDYLVLPKVNSAGDIHFLDRLLTGIELEKGLDREIAMEAAIETARGMEEIRNIARASRRLQALSFGVADYTASVGAGLASVSGHGENEAEIYPGHRWHFPLSRMVMAAKASGLAAVDAPFGNFKDLQGLKASARRARALGCDGKWAIHPDQIPVINEIFSPLPEEIHRARIILEAAEQAGPGRGAVAVQGKMVDRATVRLARELMARAGALGLAD